MWIEIREPGTNWLLARYDPQRKLLELQRRKVKTIADLKEIEDEQERAEPRRHLTYVGNKAYNVVEDTRAS